VLGELAKEQPLAEAPDFVSIQVVYELADEFRRASGMRSNAMCLEFFEDITAIPIHQGVPRRFVFAFGGPFCPIGSVKYATNSRRHHAPVFARSEKDVK
jgi:hypothetical protein